jgi:hypothetical protein
MQSYALAVAVDHRTLPRQTTPPPMIARFDRACAALLFTVLTLVTGVAAAGRAIDAEPMQGVKIRIDGQLREWPGRLLELGDTVKGSGKGTRASVKVAYDDNNLYVVLKIFDDKIVRTKAADDGEDHATFTILFPQPRGGFVTANVQLFPGKPGKVAGSVKLGGNAVAGAKIVEAPVKGGLEVEALIPWSTFSQAGRMRVGLRGAVSYSDADSPGSIRSVVATGPASGAVPSLRLEAEQALDAALIRGKGLSGRAARVAYGNVADDAMYERVAVYDNFLTVVGPKYRGGKEFYFGELGISGSKMVTRLDLADFDGDGKDEIFVQKRLGGSDRFREIVTVLKLGADGAPWLAFVHEVGIKTPDLQILNKVSLAKKAKSEITIEQGEVEGVDPAEYSEVMPSDMPSALLPWQTVGKRMFKWDGKAITKSDEDAWKPKMSGGPSAGSGPAPAKKAASSGGSEPAAAPPKPRPPSPDELLDRVYALYKKERGAGGGKPRFDFVTDVHGDRTPERVLVHGKDLVVFGKAYRGGTSFAFITIGVAEPKDVLDVSARDLTGDGKAEIVVRGVLHAKASKALGGDIVDRHALLVYRVGDAAISRIFAAETGRSLGENSIIGGIAMEPQNKGVSIELRAGRAVGWTEKNYPFPQDTTAAGGLEPLLLPWGDLKKRRYRFDGSAYVSD